MSITFTKRGISAKGKGAQALFDAIVTRVEAPAKNYIILVAPELPRSYLGAEPEEDDGEPLVGPARTADLELALIFTDFVSARAALRAAVKRYPAHQFRLDVVEPIKEAV